MASGMNGALLALGVVGAVAAAGRVVRGSFATDWRPYARQLLALSEEEEEVDSGDLSDLLERIVEDRSVTGYPRARAVRLLLDAQEEGYLDTGDALDAIQEALQSGSRAVYGMSPDAAGRTLRLGFGKPRSNAGEALADYRWNSQRAFAQYAASKKKGKGGSRAVYGMSPDTAGRTLRLGFGKPRSNAGEALNDYRWNPQRAFAQYAASKKKGKGGSRARRRIDNKEYTHYVVHIPTMKIMSGWYYPEDARAVIKDDEMQDCKVYSRRFLVTKGLDPKNNDNWDGWSPT